MLVGTKHICNGITTRPRQRHCQSRQTEAVIFICSISRRLSNSLSFEIKLMKKHSEVFFYTCEVNIHSASNNYFDAI